MEKRSSANSRARLARGGPRNFLERSGRERSEAPPQRISASFDASALLGNYRAILEQAAGRSVLPMVKANAYGHGAEWAAKLLLNMPALYGFGVASLEEGAELRKALGPKGRKAKIVVFSGANPWSDEKGRFCQQYGLTAVIATDADWHSFARTDWPGKIDYEIEFNTGMNRLGVSPSLISAIVRSLGKKTAESHPSGIFTHFAMAENPEAHLSRLQLERFIAIRREVASTFLACQFHFANSAAIWNAKYYQLEELTDVVRPGIALYGIPPWPGAPERGIRPVMTLKAAVVTKLSLKPGESIGYGATFRVTGNEPVLAAILSAGYADGLKRSLSNEGYAWVSGQLSRFLGVVSMDLSAISCTAATKPGEWAELLGPQVDPWAQAKAAGTIPYELLTSLSARVQRNYGS